MRFVLTSLAAFLISTSLLAEDVNLAGDRDLGDLAFQKQCVACHIVVNSSGKKLAGRNGRSGPNLHNVSGAVAGIVDGTDMVNRLLLRVLRRV